MFAERMKKFNKNREDVKTCRRADGDRPASRRLSDLPTMTGSRGTPGTARRSAREGDRHETTTRLDHLQSPVAQDMCWYDYPPALLS